MSVDVDIAGHQTPSRRRTVYVVDDEAGVRMALVNALEQLDYQAWPFASGEDLLDALTDIEPGCILLDIRMAGLDGIAVMRQLAEHRCLHPVIVMSAHGDIPLAVQAMKLGAIEFIEKPCTPAMLAPAVERAFDTLAAAEDDQAICRASMERLAVLTPREESVLRRLMEGQQNKVVAHGLGLSVRTVEMHRANLLNKLGLRTPQEAVLLFAQAKGLRSSALADR